MDISKSHVLALLLHTNQENFLNVLHNYIVYLLVKTYENLLWEWIDNVQQKT